MTSGILKGLTGEELLVLRIFSGDGVALAIEAELDRRAGLCHGRRTAKVDWASRNYAARHSARLAAAA